MRFADLLGDPDDDGNAPGTSTTGGPGAPASDAGAAPTGASGTFGGALAANGLDTSQPDDDLARWFTPEESTVGEPRADAEAAPSAEPEPTPSAPASRGQALATATGAIDAPEPDAPAVAPEPAAPSGVTRDDLLPARPSGHGRKRR